MDKMNQPIANYRQTEDRNSNMDCLCARKKDLKCDAQGSYKEFQKFEEIKYCVDKDGFRTTRQYYHTIETNCRIPGCEIFSDIDSCKDCSSDHCVQCPPCKTTECN